MDRRVGELPDPLRQVEGHPGRDAAGERGDDDLVVAGRVPDLADAEQRIRVDAQAPLDRDARPGDPYQPLPQPLVRVTAAVRANGHQEGAVEWSLRRTSLEHVDELVGAGCAV